MTFYLIKSFWGFEECIKVFLEVDNIHVEFKLNIKFNSQLNIPATEKSKTGQGFKLTKKNWNYRYSIAIVWLILVIAKNLVT